MYRCCKTRRDDQTLERVVDRVRNGRGANEGVRIWVGGKEEREGERPKERERRRGEGFESEGFEIVFYHLGVGLQLIIRIWVFLESP